MGKSTQLSSSFLSKFNTLPEEFKKQVMDFLETLYKKTSVQKKGKRPYGTAKGKLTVKSDFDNPIEDFNDYM